MKQDLIVGSKFVFTPGVITGVVKDEYEDYEHPAGEGDSGRVIRYDIVVIFFENVKHITYPSAAERDADYELIVESL